ncbi:MAG: hypothetical protein WDM92_08345 [Caulobacteraceae bacterium]
MTGREDALEPAGPARGDGRRHRGRGPDHHRGQRPHDARRAA